MFSENLIVISFFISIGVDMVFPWYHTFSNYLLSIYRGSNTVLSSEDKGVNKMNQMFTLLKLMFKGMRQIGIDKGRKTGNFK